jgi:hypothetical protein
MLKFPVTSLTVLLILQTVLTGCGQREASGDYVDFRDTPSATKIDAESNSSDVAVVNENDGARELKTAADNPGDGGISDDSVADLESAAAARPTVVQTTEDSSSRDDGEPTDEVPPVTPVSATSDTNDPVDQDRSGEVPTNLPQASARDELAAMMAERAALLGGGAVIDDGPPAEPLPIELLIPEKSFRRERGTEAVRVSYDDIDLLKILNMEPVPTDAVDHFPAWLQSLDGKTVRIRGFMFPTYEAAGITQFTMARDNGICCFVRKPKIYDIIAVELANGEETDYIEGRPFDVEGVFRIEPEADETELYRLYRIEDATVLR